MAEYIDRNELLKLLNDKYVSIADINSLIIDMESVDVIERSKIDKAIEKIHFLRQHRAEYITEDSKVCIDSNEVLKILKNIGE